MRSRTNPPQTFSTTTLHHVKDRLGRHAPWIDPNPARLEAAVAVVFRSGLAGLELLFIRRAEFDGDPWSGDLAFPGGRVDPGDANAEAAALRETREELGLDLSSARQLGRISDVLGVEESIRVSAFVYSIDETPELELNHEVREAFWTPLDHCNDPTRQVEKEYRYLDQAMWVPTIRLLEDERAPLLWGITYKFLEHLMAVLERPIPFMEWEGRPEDDS